MFNVETAMLSLSFSGCWFYQNQGKLAKVFMFDSGKVRKFKAMRSVFQDIPIADPQALIVQIQEDAVMEFVGLSLIRVIET